MDKVRIGIVGVGNMGSTRAQWISGGKVPRLELAALCDLDPAKLKPFPKLKRFHHSAELIRSGLADAVLIAAPHYGHTTIGVDALQQGLRVLTEKPPAVHKAAAERMIAAYRKRPKKSQPFGAMFNQRTDPHYRRPRELIQQGELGEIGRVVWISPTGSGRSATANRADGARRGAARGAACCSTNARTISACLNRGASKKQFPVSEDRREVICIEGPFALGGGGG